MRRIDYGQAIKESEEELLRPERGEQHGLLRDHLRFLRLLKTGVCHSQGEAGTYIGIKQRASEKLWKKYREQGIEAFVHYPFQGTRGKLNEEQKQQLSAALQQGNVQTLSEAKVYIEAHFGIAYTVGGVCYVFRQLHIKKKAGRPSNVRKDTEQVLKHLKKSTSSTETTL
jgi:transposase